ncbi:hypothetical protein [Gordonia hankookensis]|uniref:Uncharacterized protein n=1 Tax=Gordonia hankookensis TaxID=589403 RepID=A0ABR7WDK7_9ACTN|nr:hypothetical protein [Gordonia hankookensis]
MGADVDEWAALPDFFSAMAYWRNVQQFCAESGHAKADKILLFGTPYLDGDRLIIPNGPARAEDSEGYRAYSFNWEGNAFTLRESGRDRGTTWNNVTKAWFSSLSDIGKHFTGSYVGERTRMATNLKLPIVNLQWVDIGPAPGWSGSGEPDPDGFEPATKYHRNDDPSRYYFTDAGDSETSFRLNLSWRELNLLYTEGISGAESVLIPPFSDD